MKTPIFARKMLASVPLLLVSLLLLLGGCKDENRYQQMVGLWELQSIEEDGSAMPLSPDNPVLILFEKNGVYRSNQKNTMTNNTASPYYFSSWSVTDNTWLEMGIDTWKLALTPLNSTFLKDQWIPMHLPVRFTLLSLTDQELHLRIRTFIGDAKYTVQFTEPHLPLIDKVNYDQVFQEFRTLRTYVYKFKRK